MIHTSIPQQPATVKPPLVIRRNQKNLIARMFDTATKATYFARLGGVKKSTVSQARADYEKSLAEARSTRVLDNRNGTYTVELDWGWFDLSTTPAAPVQEENHAA